MVASSPISLAAQRQRISRNAGAYRGSLSSWYSPKTYTIDQQAYERKTSQDRAADLFANDWAANSGINAITTNSIGIGLRPQSHINAKRLGITRDQALELQNDIEAIWAEWTPHAHAQGVLHFEELQLLGLHTMLRLGEMIHLPVMVKSPNKKIQLALQNITPSRLRTPYNKIYSPNIIDGVEYGNYGKPEYYWLASPSAAQNQSFNLTSFDIDSLCSNQFSRIPAQIGHRPVNSSRDAILAAIQGKTPNPINISVPTPNGDAIQTTIDRIGAIGHGA